jgi:hypothetical protein
MDKNRQRLDHKDRPVQGANGAMNEPPGVPLERPSRDPLTPATHWREPERMRDVAGVTRRMELKQMTPVFSTALPPRGLSGLIRRKAYSLPETHARHWMTLLFADRVELWEHRVARLVKVVAMVPVGIAGVLLVARMLRSRS